MADQDSDEAAAEFSDSDGVVDPLREAGESPLPPPIAGPSNDVAPTAWQRFNEHGLYPTLLGIGALGFAALGYLVFSPELGPDLTALPPELLAAAAALIILSVPATMFVMRHRRLKAELWRIQRELELTTTRTRALRRVNTELRDALGWYRSLVNEQDHLVLRQDLNGRVTFANEAVAQLAGHPVEQLMGRPLALNVDPRTQRDFNALLAELQDPPHQVRCEERVLTPRGWRWIAWHTLALRDEDGRPREVQSNGHDITAHKLVESQLTSARNEAQRANRAKSSFLATISHEIRTPLNGILGMAELLRNTAQTAEQRDYTQAVRDSGEALMAIINDILDFSKIEAGRLDLEARDFDLAPVVERVCQLLAPRAHGKGIEIGAHVDLEVPRRLNGDAGRLRQVLLNLAGNAVKFTEAGGVQIGVTAVSNTDDRVVLLFEIRDTGVGIPLEAQDRLFEAFTQADSGTDRQHGGTGLGLAISERMVRLMNGQIGVESTPGEGSTFWFVAEFAAPEDATATQAPPKRKLAGERILLADANDVSRALNEKLLRDAGAEVNVAADREEATDWLRASAASSRPFGTLLLDTTLPDEDLKVLARLARTASPATAPRVLAVARPGDRERLSSFQARVLDGCLVKPLMPTALAMHGLIGQQIESAPPAIAERRSGADRRRIKLVGKPAAPVAQGQRILLADDNNINQLLAETLLKRLGAIVDSVNNGARAIDAMRREDYTLVLMDVHMPGMDGLEATRQIRRLNGKRGQVPIIALTANGADEDRQKCLAAGMNDYLIKPLDHDALTQALLRWAMPAKAANAAGGSN